MKAKGPFRDRRIKQAFQRKTGREEDEEEEEEKRQEDEGGNWSMKQISFYIKEQNCYSTSLKKAENWLKEIRSTGGQGCCSLLL